MKKKYAIRRKKRTISTLYIFVIILVILISISIGYSKFSSQLNIVGKVELGRVGDPEFPLLQISESTLLVGIESHWKHEGIYYYNISLIFKNLDHDFKGWKIAIDVPANVYDDRTLLPLRFIAEAFDCKVEWTEFTQNGIQTGGIVDITTK